MRRLLNTLYVTTPESYISNEGENILIKVGNETRFRIPIHNLEGIVCFGYNGASPSAMHLCVERGVGLSFLTERGYFLARVSGKVSGNVFLRRKQYRWADEEQEKLRLAKRFVESKLHNSRTVLQRALRDNENAAYAGKFENVIASIKNMIARVEEAHSIDIVRGIEGEGSSEYFSCFNDLIISQKESFSFNGRTRRPPRDSVNALLSFAYTLLEHEYISALETVGLDPQVGYLHTDRPGRRSLALDLMEELRPFMADRIVLSLINRREILGSGFVRMESGAVVMSDEIRKTILVSWQNRKREELTHPFIKEKVPIGLIPYVQSMLLARNIRGDLDDYPPFLWK